MGAHVMLTHRSKVSWLDRAMRNTSVGVVVSQKQNRTRQCCSWQSYRVSISQRIHRICFDTVCISSRCIAFPSLRCFDTVCISLHSIKIFVPSRKTLDIRLGSKCRIVWHNMGLIKFLFCVSNGPRSLFPSTQQ